MKYLQRRGIQSKRSDRTNDPYESEFLGLDGSSAVLKKRVQIFINIQFVAAAAALLGCVCVYIYIVKLFVHYHFHCQKCSGLVIPHFVTLNILEEMYDCFLPAT